MKPEVGAHAGTAAAPPPTAASREQAPWWDALYDENLAAVLLERSDPGEIAAALDFLEDALCIDAGARVFDQCCGNGRLALPLARRGFAVTGVDWSAAYVDQGLREAERQGVSLSLCAGDAFEHVPRPACDAAFNWWTSFGYAERDDDNVRMLECAFAALVPGGCYALDFMNAPGLLREFQREVLTRAQTPDGEILLLRESELDLATGILHKRWTFSRPEADAAGGSRSTRPVVHHSRVRLYQPHELVALLERAGFRDVTLHGDVTGAPLGLDSPRCIAVGRRPA